MKHQHRYFDVAQNGEVISIPADCNFPEWQLLALVKEEQCILNREKLNIQLVFRESTGELGCIPELVISSEDIGDIILIPKMESGWIASLWPPRRLGDDSSIVKLSEQAFSIYRSPVALALQTIWAVNEQTLISNGGTIPDSVPGRKIYEYAEEIRCLGGPFDTPTHELIEVLQSIWYEREEARYHSWYFDTDQ